MGDGVVFLTFSSKSVTEDAQSLIACKHCRNKTFKVIHFYQDFPLLQCAACDSHISRFGWAPDAQE